MKNNKKWKEWTHLEITGSTTYKGRTFKKNVPDNAEKLMNSSAKSMNSSAKSMNSSAKIYEFIYKIYELS